MIHEAAHASTALVVVVVVVVVVADFLPGFRTRAARRPRGHGARERRPRRTARCGAVRRRAAAQQRSSAAQRSRAARGRRRRPCVAAAEQPCRCPCPCPCPCWPSAHRHHAPPPPSQPASQPNQRPHEQPHQPTHHVMGRTCRTVLAGANTGLPRIRAFVHGELGRVGVFAAVWWSWGPGGAALNGRGRGSHFC